MSNLTRTARFIPYIKKPAVAVRLTRGFATMTSQPNKKNHDDDNTRQQVLEQIAKNESVRNTMAYSLSMATHDGSKFPPIIPPLDKRMEEQLRISKNQLCRKAKRAEATTTKIDNDALPRNIGDALRTTKRAIVVTETANPFKIVNVNQAWEGLCGYTHVESKGQSLGALLQGPETDQAAVTALLNQLLRGEDATTVLTNYTKTGRKFRNRLHVGPMYDDSGSLEYFVGVLQEV